LHIDNISLESVLFMKAKSFSENGKIRRDCHFYSDGFTLIELSIVLVIIGLIVGGILVGQDLVRAAGIRSQISQIEKYNTAVNTFRGKYGYLPGDILNTVAATAGLSYRIGGIANGDGDGVIMGMSNGQQNQINGAFQGGENEFFWLDLSYTGLIKETVSSKANDPLSSLFGTAGYACTNDCNAYLPNAALSTRAFVTTYSNNSTNYYAIVSIDTSFSPANNYGYLGTLPSMTVRQAYNIDQKVDDGLPQTGNVITQYYNTWQVIWSVSGMSGSSSTCFDTSSGKAAYSINQNNGTGINCALSFKIQ
jgi:prepilin-type N-terminal cleavage/methylation domain-containing protein